MMCLLLTSCAAAVPLYCCAAVLLRRCTAAVTLFSFLCCRLIRQGMAKKVERSRKQLKEKKNRLRKVRGIKKAKN